MLNSINGDFNNFIITLLIGCLEPWSFVGEFEVARKAADEVGVSTWGFEDKGSLSRGSHNAFFSFLVVISFQSDSNPTVIRGNGPLVASRSVFRGCHDDI